jgi:hypothetical protein
MSAPILVHAEVARMAQERQEAINADHPLVREFWDMVEFLNGPLVMPAAS